MLARVQPAERARSLALAVATVASLLASGARADTAAAAPASALADAGDADRLRSFVALAAADARRDRLHRMIYDGATAVVQAPVGVALVTRSDPGVEAVGVTVLVRAGADLLDVGLFGVFPSPLESLPAEYDERLARGMAPALAKEETERAWKDAIRSAHAMSTVNAVIDFVLGPAEVAVGTYFLIAKPLGGLDRQAQTTWGAILLGLGFPGVAYGFDEISSEPAVERWWRAYQQGRSAPPARGPVTFPVSFAVAPIPQGAMATLRLGL